MSTGVNQRVGYQTQPYSFADEAAVSRLERTSSHSSRYQRWVLIAVLVLSDALMVGLALLTAWYVRIESGLFAYYAEAPLEIYLQAIAVAVPLMLGVFLLSGLYDYKMLLGGTKEYEAALRACSYGVVALVFVSFMWRELVLSRGWLIISWAMVVLLVCTSRFFWRRVFCWLRRHRGWFVTPTLIVGANEQGRAIARQIDGARAGMEVVGFVDDFLPPGTEVISGKAVLAAANQLQEVAAAHRVGCVIVIQNGVAWETYRDILQQASLLNHFELLLSPGFYEILTTGVQVTSGGFVPLLRVNKARITGIDLALKTAMDFSLGFLLLILTSPVMLFCGAALWVSAGQSVFYRYEVLGLGGRPFHTTKFRTGFHGSSYRRLSGTNECVTSDVSCHSRIGRLLYHSGLDKLPQLVDVVRGRMSLVGPRAVSPPVGNDLGYEMLNLLTLKPGWTGLWAVGEACSLEDEMRLNMYYIRNWTIWLDLQVLFSTARLAIARKSRPAVVEEVAQRP
jgi:lipopolysaccharide/colanic/teichoic acid biosynthesis glycosyltransferase